MSIRVPGAQEMYYTAAPSLRDPPASAVARIGLDGSGLPDGVPVAAYGPRGSDEAIANIRAAVAAGVPAVLLAHHGVLVFHRTPQMVIMLGGVVEEAAQAGLNAERLGGPVELPESMKAAALQRSSSFEAQGTRRA